VVERLIRRCMERDPNARPASVSQLALALPGGDPLAAAIAAGETPSPEMVAASGGKEGLKLWIAWATLALIIIGLFVVAAIGDGPIYRRVPFEKSPEALVERSRLFLQRAGLSGQFKDSAWGFMVNGDLLNYIETSDKSENRWKKLDARAILFWYRQSPQPLGLLGLESGSTSPDNPPLRYSGEVLLILDSEGRLQSLRCVPIRLQLKAETVRAPDWAAFFAEAGLDISRWMPANAQWTPPFHADSRAAWQDSLPGGSGTQVRVEAASFQGKPVSFEVIDPWAQPSRTDYAQQRTRLSGVLQVARVVIIIATLSGIFFARRNLRLGRGDRRNATRLAVFVLGAFALQWALKIPQVSLKSLLLGGYMAVMFWILYMAIEPYARRRWPQVLVSWTRLLSGEWRDPLVARDTLVGVAFGILMICVSVIGQRLLPSPLAVRDNGTLLVNLQSFLGARFVISDILTKLLAMILISMATLCLIVVLGVLLKSRKAAIAAFIILFTVFAGSDLGYVTGLTFSVLWILALMRFGFVAAILMMFINCVTHIYFTALPISAWYSPYCYLALAILAVIVLYAFPYSLGGRPLLASSRLDE